MYKTFEIVNPSMDHPAYKQTRQRTYVLYLFKCFILPFLNFLEILVNFLTICKLPLLLFKFLTFVKLFKFSELVDTMIQGAGGIKFEHHFQPTLHSTLKIKKIAR